MAPITVTYPVAAGALANAVGTQFNVRVNADCGAFATVALSILSGVAVALAAGGAAGSVDIPYSKILIVVGCVARLSTTDAAFHALFPFRGVFQMVWLQAALRTIDCDNPHLRPNAWWTKC